MWRTLALVATVLTVAASLFAVRAAPEPRPLPDARPTQSVPTQFAPSQSAEEAFAAICREGVVENRRDPPWLGQSYLGDNCVAPRTPAVIKGATASREEIVAGMEQVKRYAAAAASFQKCVGDFVAARGQGNAAPLTPAQIIIQNYRIRVAEKNKEAAERQMHMTIMAFNSYGSDCPM